MGGDNANKKQGETTKKPPTEKSYTYIEQSTRALQQLALVIGQSVGILVSYRLYGRDTGG